MSHLTSKFKSTPTYTFKSRNQSITSSNRDQNRPSPFHYNGNPLQLSKQPKPLGKFSHSSREKSLFPVDASKLPGPGAYESTSSVNLESFHKGEALKRGQKRFNDHLQNATPGPSHYRSVENSSKGLPKYSFYREKRVRQLTHSLSALPSPDSYNPSYIPKEQNSSFSIGHAKRKENILPTRSPGPGAYIQERQFISTSFNQKSQILPRAKRTNSSSSLTPLPAPNSYNFQSFIDQNAKKHRGFTTQRRYSCKLLQTPSPNNYHNDALVHRYQVKVGFPRSQRTFLTHQLRRSGSLPGPGSHQVDLMGNLKFKSTNGSKFPKSKLAHLLQNRPTTKISFINPEKLDYSKRSIPKFSIPSAKARENTPKVEVDKFYDVNQESQRSRGSFKIPKEKRMEEFKQTNVGPGYYSTQITTITTRKIKFPKEKRRTFMDQAIEGKLKLFRDESYQNREQFPNPPKYMNVHKKLSINDGAIKKY